MIIIYVKSVDFLLDDWFESKFTGGIRDSYQIPDHATSTFQDFYSKITTVCGHFGFYDFDNISNRLSGKGSLHLVSRINPSCRATCPTDGATQRPGAWNSS